MPILALPSKATTVTDRRKFATDILTTPNQLPQSELQAIFSSFKGLSLLPIIYELIIIDSLQVTCRQKNIKMPSQRKRPIRFGLFLWWALRDSNYLRQARNFAAANKFAPEGCLAACHRHASPRPLDGCTNPQCHKRK